jgi:hypothetical protein
VNQFCIKSLIFIYFVADLFFLLFSLLLLIVNDKTLVNFTFGLKVGVVIPAKMNQSVLAQEKLHRRNLPKKTRCCKLSESERKVFQQRKRRKHQQEASLEHECSNDATHVNQIHHPLHYFLNKEELDNMFSESTPAFDTACKTLKHSHCKVCHSASLNLVVGSNGMYTACKLNNRHETEHRDSLPIWHEDLQNKRNPRFDLPSELSCLREVEKLLIQQISCYVPMHHLRNGQIGSKGHVCCFEQIIEEVCTMLPRLACNVKIIRAVKQCQKEGGEIGKTTFCI